MNFTRFSSTVAFATLCICSVIEAGSVAAQDVPLAKKYRYWTTRWSFDDIDIGKLFDRLQGIGIEIPIDADGDVSLNFAVSIPLNGLRDAEAYRLSGNISSQRLRLEELQLANFSADIQYDSGVLSLDKLTTQWDDSARLSGYASLELAPRGDIDASFTATELTLGPLYDLIVKATRAQVTPPLKGTIDGSLAIKAPLSNLRDISAWTVNADLRADQLTYDGTLPLTLHTGPLRLREGKLVARDVRMGSPVDATVRMAASVEADLRGERPFRIDLRGDDVPLDSIAKLASLRSTPPVTGKLDIDARGIGKLGSGDFATATWNIEGRIASPQLTALGVQLGLIEHQFVFDASRLAISRLSPSATSSSPNDEQFVIEKLNAKYRIQKATIELTQLNAAIFGGMVQGQAAIARIPTGTHHTKLQWQSISPRIDTNFLFGTRFLSSAKSQLSFRTSGDVDWTVPANAVEKLDAHRGSARLAIAPIRLGSVNIGDGNLVLQAADGQLDLKGKGTLLGGTFDVDTRVSLAALASGFRALANQPETLNGHARFSRVNVSRASRLLMPNDPRRWDGLLFGKVDFSAAQSEMRLSLDALSIDRQMISRRIDADVIADRSGLQINSLRGAYAGGRIEAMGKIQLPDGRGRLQVRVSAVDASDGLLLVSPQVASYIGGSLSARLTIETGQQIRARGSVTLRDSQLQSIPLGTAHAALTASAVSNLSRWTLDLRGIESRLGHGQLIGDARLSSSNLPNAFDLASSWQARRVDFGRLLDDAGVGSSYAGGNLSGRVTVNGKGVRGISDLTGRFDAELDGSQTRSIPGLMLTQAYLGAFSLAGARVQEGRARGTIAAGSARLDEFWLLGDQFRVLAQGRVRLNNGRMDVSAVISTGNFDLQSAGATRVAALLALDAVFPVGTLVQINQLFSDRTVYVDVIGPISDPRVRLKPLSTLRDAARRRLFRQAVSTVSPLAIGGTSFSNDDL